MPAVESGRRAATAIRFARGVVVAGLAVWTWQFAAAPMGVAVADSVLHLPNLVFHEAGHVILGVFGRFISVLGGSLFQFAVPLILYAIWFLDENRLVAFSIVALLAFTTKEELPLAVGCSGSGTRSGEGTGCSVSACSRRDSSSRFSTSCG